jgi:hypothetical protein
MGTQAIALLIYMGALPSCLLLNSKCEALRLFSLRDDEMARGDSALRI